MSSSLAHLLAQTKTILEHQKQAEILRGESFNIFSVLSMESKENKTHSAFLRELLDPNGSHLQGVKFLKLFLNGVGYVGALDYKTASVKVEHHVGSVDLTNKSGGRIDIYIWDDSDHTISIENKILAGDQEAQVERYVNHNKEKNTVYYLTLHGTEPSDNSRGEYKSGKDFYNLSYKEDIRAWLESCMKEAADIPILRESIKQYIILLKKLTNTMDDKSSKQLQELIKNNYTASKAIVANVPLAEEALYLSFFEELKTQLEVQLVGSWTVSNNAAVNAGWCGISIMHEDWEGLTVALQKAENKLKGAVLSGICVTNDLLDRTVIKEKLSNIELFDDDFESSKVWPYHKGLFSLTSDDDKAKLFDDKLRADFIQLVVEHLVAMAKHCEKPLKNVPTING